MLILKVRRPRWELRPYIRTFAQREIGPASSEIVEPIPAQLEQHLTFDFGCPVEVLRPDGRIQLIDRTSTAGAQTRFAAHLRLRSGVESFGVFFGPTGFSQLFGVPMSELTDCLGDAGGLVGYSIRALWNRLGESSSFEDRIVVAEEFLMCRAARAQTGSTIVAAANYVFRHHGAVKIADLAHRGSTGLRQFERQFRREVGASPKTFARIARFQAALDAKVAAPKRTWLDIAHSFGYYDQMHMIHDFELLGCDSPTQLVTRLGDSRPPSLAPEENKQVVAFLIGGSQQLVEEMC
jgi:AraC-like DNA-binding protein